MNKPKIKMTGAQFYELTKWIEANAEDLVDVKYPERAAMATEALGFPVIESRAREASELTGNEHQFGRINTLYFAMVALAHSGGTTPAALARKGREIVRASRKSKPDDGTPDMFPDAPGMPEVPAAGVAEVFAADDDAQDSTEPGFEFSAGDEFPGVFGSENDESMEEPIEVP